MRLAKLFAVNLFIFVTFASFANAQELPKMIKGGVLNGKAISLPKPAYPAEARAGKIEGTVRIKVLIDEEGNVVEAEESTDPIQIVELCADCAPRMVAPEPGDPNLVEAAVAAAKEARFSPTKLSGVPVKVTGVIVYNFVASGGAMNTKGTISGGVLNGKALELPPAGYPPAAKAVRASGAVSVQIIVDENGDVIKASAVSGHPLLRAAATDAARLAKFSPTKLSGQSVKVSGVLTYNFVLPDVGKN